MSYSKESVVITVAVVCSIGLGYLLAQFEEPVVITETILSPPEIITVQSEPEIVINTVVETVQLPPDVIVKTVFKTVQLPPEIITVQSEPEIVTETITEIQTVVADAPIAAALKYVGLHERRNRGVLEWTLGIDPARTPWCAAFVNTVLDDVGLVGTDSNLARSFLNWGEETDTPTTGDIVVFSRPPVSWQGHVGFYINTVMVDGVEYYRVLGGNQGNEVGIQNYPTRRLLSIRKM